MEKIDKVQGLAIPLMMDDVDTDLIIPAQYLTSVTKAGYGEHLFYRLRQSDSEFVFNQTKYKNAKVLIARNNFGCGSSREHAVWALQQGGIQAVIAVSFADIFSDNSASNGLLLIKLAEDIIENMLARASQEQYIVSIDIKQQTLSTNSNETFNFSIDEFYKHCLLHGLEKLDYLLSHQQQIKDYRRAQADKNFVRFEELS